MEPMLKVAKQEAERLRLVLSKNEDYQKLQHVQRVIDTYEAFEGLKTSGLSPVAEAPAKVSITQSERKDYPSGYGSKVAAVDRVISEHFAKTGVRASSGDLMPVIQRAGLEMTGKVPAKTLSSFLTTSKLFNNVKGFGYGLVEWGESLGPKAAPSDVMNFTKSQSDLLGSRDGENNSGAGDDRS